MRKVFYIVAFTILGFSCSTDLRYTINGTLGGDAEGKVYLEKREGSELIKKDSADLANGKFTLTGVVEYPEMVYLRYEEESTEQKPAEQKQRIRSPRLGFYIENAEITITGHPDTLYNAEVTGSSTHDEYSAYVDGMNRIYEDLGPLSEKLRKAKEADDEAMVKEIETAREEIYDRAKEFRMTFVRENTSSFVAPAVLRGLVYYMEGEELESHLDAFATALNAVPVVAELREKAEILKTVAIGKPAPDFTLNDPDGNPVTLSSLSGKYLLIDFWASWCGPCRRENPNVVAVWKDYNEKGFDVLGVSLDRPDEKDSWLKAIEDDQLTWTHVSDLKYWDCEPAKRYAVSGIPANFLLDKEGVIIAKNLRGDDLRVKISELLD